MMKKKLLSFLLLFAFACSMGMVDARGRRGGRGGRGGRGRGGHTHRRGGRGRGRGRYRRSVYPFVGLGAWVGTGIAAGVASDAREAVRDLERRTEQGFKELIDAINDIGQRLQDLEEKLEK